jgi:hypothetical protein
MLQSDRIKITSSSRFFTIPPNSDFITCTNKKTGTTYQKYTSKSPYFLSIMVNKKTDRATVEFTSKILGDRCVELISINNIQECFRRIHESGVCYIEVEKISAEAVVSRLDITIDMELPMTDAMKTILQMALIDSKKWESKIRKRDGIDIRKDVKSDSRRKERLSFYNKGREIKLSKNKPFLNSLSSGGRVTEHFQNKTRVEYNLSSGSMVKEVLQIENLELMTVLACRLNPIARLCDRIFDRTLLENLQQGKLSYMLFDSINDFYRHLLLEKYEDNQKDVDSILKHFYSPNTNIRSLRRQFKATKNKRLSASHDFINHVELFDLVMNQIKDAG